MKMVNIKWTEQCVSISYVWFKADVQICLKRVIQNDYSNKTAGVIGRLHLTGCKSARNKLT